MVGGKSTTSESTHRTWVNPKDTYIFTIRFRTRVTLDHGRESASCLGSRK